MNCIDNFHNTILEIVSQLNEESAALFLKVFEKKLKELHEQTANLQKNSGASRSR